MWVQVIQGKTKDAAGLEKQWRRWAEEIKPKREGFLGSTSGVTADGEFISVARFESEEAARKTESLPEQDQWWKETEQLLENVTFRDCKEVQTWLDGGSDDAGFVQIIQAKGTDEDRDRMNQPGVEDEIRKTRPDVIGGLVAIDGGGTYTNVVYFTSEAEARKGESSQEFQEREEREGGPPQDAKFFDLTNPWFD